MDQYIYCTEIGNLWICRMLKEWKKSGRQFLSFPWIKTRVHKITTDRSQWYWLYVYYSKGKTSVPSLTGMIEYRFRVREWRWERKFTGLDTYCARSKEVGKVWFKCDLCQEIESPGGGLLSLDDFEHRKGLLLSSAIRNSIPPVILRRGLGQLRIVRAWEFCAPQGEVK